MAEDQITVIPISHTKLTDKIESPQQRSHRPLQLAKNLHGCCYLFKLLKLTSPFAYYLFFTARYTVVGHLSSCCAFVPFCDRELCPVTLTVELDLDVCQGQPASCQLSTWSKMTQFKSCGPCRHAHTHTHTGSTALPEPLKWSTMTSQRTLINESQFYNRNGIGYAAPVSTNVHNTSDAGLAATLHGSRPGVQVFQGSPSPSGRTAPIFQGAQLDPYI